jgi:PAS domain S-box-containing protein
VVVLTNGRLLRRRRGRRGLPGDLRSIAVVEQALSPACVLDSSGRIVAANRQLKDLLGCGIEGLTGRSIASLAYPPDADLTRDAVAALFDKGVDRQQADTRCVRIDNQQLVWTALDLSLVRDNRGRPSVAVVMVRDRTEVMRSEQERRFLEFILKTLGEAETSDDMLAAALETVCHFTRCSMGQVWLPDGDTLGCSPAWYSRGYGMEHLRSASQLLRYPRGSGLPGLVWASGQPCLLAEVEDPSRFDRAAAAGRAGVGEALAVPMYGGAGLLAVLEFFVAHERAGEPGRQERIAKVVDELGPVIERRRAEEALRVSEERFRGVTDAAMDAIVSADAEGRLRSWNRGAERMFGWRPEEVIGRPLTVIVPERLRAAHVEGIARVRRTGRSKLAGSVVELVALRRDGSEFPVELSIGAWETAEGLSFSGVIRDITERKRAEEALAAANRELERTNAELETLVYSASHDLKSPMVSLLGYLEYLRLDYGELLGEEGGRYVQRISECTLYMQRLIHDLIELSRAGRLTLELDEVDLGALARTILAEARAVHPSVRFHAGPLPVILADPLSFRQLFTNLVENAVRHGGRTDLSVSIESSPLPDGSFELLVRDDGKGIPPEHRERVFGVFERLDGASTSHGTGMGLAICRKVVELAGGSIAIAGSRGTVVRMVLPATMLARWPEPEPHELPLHDTGALA